MLSHPAGREVPVKIRTRTIIAVAAIAAVGAFIGWRLGRGSQEGSFFSTRPVVNEKATLAILRSEAMSFLVTRRTTTQIIVEHEESNWLGSWHGVLWATVSWRWGVDLGKLTEKNLRREGDTLVCRLGEPELLDFGVEPNSIHHMSKSTAVPKVINIFSDGWQRVVLESRVQDYAMKFADDNKLRPSRNEIVRQLNDAAATLKTATGFELRFE